MRYHCAVFALWLFVVSVGAYGGDIAQPMPTNGKCSVPADPRWTPQETFVWQHVCIGEVANFNSGQAYGGDLDPRRSEGLPESRILRPAFLEAILLADKYRHAITRLGVRIIGARFTETIDLSNAELERELWLDRSLLEKGANFSRLKSTNPVSLDGSKVIGKLEMSMLNINEDLLMGDKGEFGEVVLAGAHVEGQVNLSSSKVTGALNMHELNVDEDLCMGDNGEFEEVVLIGAHVGGQLDLGGSKVTGALKMDELKVDEDLSMGDKGKFGEVMLALAHVGGQVNLNSSKVTGKLDMDSLKVDHSLFMRDKGEFGEVALTIAHVGGVVDLSGSKVTGRLAMAGLKVDEHLLMGEGEFGEVVLTGAHVGGQVNLNGSKVTGKLNMDSLKVDQSLFMSHESGFGEVVLTGAHVGGQVSLSGSKVTGRLGMDRLKVDQSLFMRDKGEFGQIVLKGAHVGGQVDLSDSKVTGRLDIEALEAHSDVWLGDGAEFDGPVTFFFSNVSGSLVLAGGTFYNIVDLTGTRVGAELHLGSSRSESARWLRGSTLVLRNAEANAIQDLSDSWPAELDLNGFNYRSLGGIYGAEKDPMIDRGIEWFKSWLRTQKAYTPAPYTQLALVLRNVGKPEVANAILYAGKERERSQSQSLGYVQLTASKLFIGYGYHLFWSMYWALGFLFIGTLVLWVSGEGCRISRHYNLFYGLFYSFDLLLPIIRLREKHYQIDLRGWVRYYFYVHRIMGYVLVSFLIAGISGLTTK
jgi:hypothetical protein